MAGAGEPRETKATPPLQGGLFSHRKAPASKIMVVKYKLNGFNKGGSTMEDPQDFDLEYITESPKGLCVKHGASRVWLPKSQIEYTVKSYKKGDAITVEVPEWLATDKGLA